MNNTIADNTKIELEKAMFSSGLYDIVFGYILFLVRPALNITPNLSLIILILLIILERKIKIYFINLNIFNNTNRSSFPKLLIYLLLSTLLYMLFYVLTYSFPFINKIVSSEYIFVVFLSIVTILFFAAKLKIYRFFFYSILFVCSEFLFAFLLNKLTYPYPWLFSYGIQSLSMVLVGFALLGSCLKRYFELRKVLESRK